ncbi:MAG: glucose-1-phosphate adenylyltransferase [Candidatus Abyssobacteria bacterium SURF_5]|uniref:Glucose-1-phosphate adenylyltransferase n=1 Tax=Abyssobacteria bacterium (strain SURF_5) TaxID=2093360 RepID=A0A3A4NIA0_ABYX5|nr:MAG: glucose-1-phosphate adenylyltransferase [Candidatus Abyssubacteria bacterium SURF_5]
MNSREVLGVILAGGAGQRLYPLTKEQAKPAVVFGGTYRLIDFTLSNAVNSNIRHIFILSQYKSDSLHRHIHSGWNLFASELDEFITILPPQQRINDQWYSGTASAVRQNLYSINGFRPKYVLILSADHVYKMDYAKMLDYHKKMGAEITVGAIEVRPEDTHRFGILQVDADQRITDFVEKPKNLTACRNGGCPVASMGIYLFNIDALNDVLARDIKEELENDFGKDIIPSALRTRRIHAYQFIDENKKRAKYWRDVGTIDSYWEANMDLVAVDPEFNLYDSDWPIRTYHPQYPPAKTVFAGGKDGRRVGLVLDSIISNGCIISGGRVQNSVLSFGVRVNSYADISQSILMEGVRVGRSAKIRRAIIGKNVIIPPGALIGYDWAEDRKRFTVSENGVVVVPEETIIRPASLAAELGRSSGLSHVVSAPFKKREIASILPS